MILAVLSGGGIIVSLQICKLIARAMRVNDIVCLQCRPQRFAPLF
jgi:hypothetical protein